MKLSFDPKFFFFIPNTSFIFLMPHSLTNHKYMIYSNLEFLLSELKIRIVGYIIKNDHKLSHLCMHCEFAVAS